MYLSTKALPDSYCFPCLYLLASTFLLKLLLKWAASQIRCMSESRSGELMFWEPLVVLWNTLFWQHMTSDPLYLHMKICLFCYFKKNIYWNKEKYNKSISNDQCTVRRGSDWNVELQFQGCGMKEEEEEENTLPEGQRWRATRTCFMCRHKRVHQLWGTYMLSWSFILITHTIPGDTLTL